MYLNTTTLTQHSESDIRALNTNTSFPTPFQAPEGYSLVFPSPAPTHNPVTQSVREVAPLLTAKGHYEQAWEVLELFATQAEKDSAIAADTEAKRLAAVPVSVTRRQAKQALILQGLISGVQPAINAITDATQRALIQCEWDDSQVFERQRPALIMLGTALGLGAAALDALFVSAAAL